MFPEQIGERFVRQFLNGRHPVARELFQLVERVVVEGDQFTHERICLQHMPGQLWWAEIVRVRNCRPTPSDHKARFPNDQKIRDRVDHGDRCCQRPFGRLSAALPVKSICRGCYQDRVAKI